MRTVKQQATIEELVAMNEQLKASNVELQQKITERERLQHEFNQFFDRSLDATELKKANELLIKDIIERKRAEEKLRESEGLYRSLIETSPDAITLTGLDGKIIMANRQASLMHGFENSEEYIGRSAFDLIMPEDRDLAMENARRTLETGRIRNVEYALLRKDGSSFQAELSASLIVDAEGRPKGFIGVFRDITARKKAENALRESEKKYRKLFHNANDAIFLISYQDGMPGSFIEVNDVACQRLGYSRDELTAMKTTDIVPEEFSEVLPEIWKKFLEAGESTFEVTLVSKKGQEIPVEISTHLFTLGGEPVALSIARDVTERKRAEDELYDARRKAEQAERMASLGTMVAGIAHEINQPLNSIYLLVDGLLYWYEKGSVFDAGEVIEELGKISAQAERINMIIRRMRSFVRNEHPLKLAPCNLNNAVESALAMIGNQLSAHEIKLKLSLQDELPAISGENLRLEEVVVNLLVNAMHALNGTGKKEKVINIATRAEKIVILEISDNATGINRKIKDKIFDPFFTTNGVGGGMGLGLSIVHSIVTSFNGKIHVMANKMGGATFRVEFPVLKKDR